MSIDQLGGSSKSFGVPFLVSAEVVLAVVAAACSSPQTAEINADKRAGTLMKWVNIGSIFAISLVGIAAIVDKEHRRALILGGTYTLVFMYAAYVHAKSSGLSNKGPGTES